MAARYVRVEEVQLVLGIDETFLHTVSEEGLVEIKHSSEHEAVMSTEDAERLRLITVLMREMDVNLAGAEVILHMREDLCAMQRQFDEILHALVDELRRRMSTRGE